jgi:hypothetical protein
MTDHTARIHEPDFRRYALLIALAAEILLCCRDDAKVVLAREDKYREVGIAEAILRFRAYQFLPDHEQFGSNDRQ